MRRTQLALAVALATLPAHALAQGGYYSVTRSVMTDAERKELEAKTKAEAEADARRKAALAAENARRDAEIRRRYDVDRAAALKAAQQVKAEQSAAAAKWAAMLAGSKPLPPCQRGTLCSVPR